MRGLLHRIGGLRNGGAHRPRNSHLRRIFVLALATLLTIGLPGLPLYVGAKEPPDRLLATDNSSGRQYVLEDAPLVAEAWMAIIGAGTGGPSPGLGTQAGLTLQFEWSSGVGSMAPLTYFPGAGGAWISYQGTDGGEYWLWLDADRHAVILRALAASGLEEPSGGGTAPASNYVLPVVAASVLVALGAVAHFALRARRSRALPASPPDGHRP
jgi:hypothetical protein